MMLLTEILDSSGHPTLSPAQCFQRGRDLRLSDWDTAATLKVQMCVCAVLKNLLLTPVLIMKSRHPGHCLDGGFTA